MSEFANFSEWAEAQFGKRPRLREEDDAILQEIHTLAAKLERLRAIRQRCEEYDGLINAALYGWQAGPGKKEAP